MKVLIIEDEYPAAQKLTRLIREIDNSIEIAGNLTSVEDSINWFRQHPAPDLILMDIRLEDGSSFEVFEKVHLETPVVFTTAYDEYAIKAFKVNSVDYLLKPISAEDLKKAFNKFKATKLAVPYGNLLRELSSAFQPRKKERFLVKVGERYRSIQTNDINYFYIDEHCNFINAAENKNYAIDYSLDSIETLVDQKKFFRINRNFIVHISSIKDIITYSSNRLKLVIDPPPGRNVLVSRERVKDFKRWIDQ